MFSEQFLQMLRCPVTHTRLTLADQAVVDAINEQISAGHVKNRAGDQVERPLDGGLVDSEGRWLFPVYDHIPQLIADEAVSLEVAATSPESDHD